jgi:hypothetical protein
MGILPTTSYETTVHFTMNTSLQQYFDEFAQLPLVDESFRQRFEQELRDHIDDTLHDDAVRGMEEAASVEGVLKRLGSPKHLQKNFNRMMKKYSPSQIAVLVFATLLTTLAFVMTAFGFEVMLTWILQFTRHLMGLSVVDYFNPWQDLKAMLIISGAVLTIATLLSFLTFRAVFTEWLTVHFSRKTFLALFGIIIAIPAVASMAQMLTIFTSSDLVLAELGESKQTELLLAIVQGVIGQLLLPMAYLFVLFALTYGLMQKRLYLKALPSWATRMRNSVPTVFGALACLYVLSTLVTLWVPLQDVYYGSALFPEGEQLLLQIYGFPFAALYTIQGMLLNTILSNTSTPWIPTIVFGSLYVVMVIASAAYVALTIWKIRTKQKQKTFRWIIPVTGLFCAMMLLGVPHPLTPSPTAQFVVPHSHLNASINQQHYKPFYRFYLAQSITSPTTFATSVENDQLVIDRLPYDVLKISIEGSVENYQFTRSAQRENNPDRWHEIQIGRVDTVIANRITCEGLPFNEPTDDPNMQEQLDTYGPFDCSRFSIDGKLIFTQPIIDRYSGHGMQVEDVEIIQNGQFASLIIRDPKLSRTTQQIFIVDLRQ